MISDLYKKYLDSTGVCTDTRLIFPGNLFFALRGDNFNGNEYASEALDKGASYAIIDDPDKVKNDRYILVKDVLNCLQELASYHRSQLDIPIIAITGSNGKTTTKELIISILSCKYKVTATIGNLNNHIGVPLSVLSIDSDTEIGIIEMGANHIGEISDLCSIAKPTHGVITNIGTAHTEGFGGFEGVVRAKSELYHYLIHHEGVIFVNSNIPILVNMARNRIKNPVYYPNENDYMHCEFVKADPYVSYCTKNSKIVDTQLIGEYNFENISTALCIGKYFKVAEKKYNQAVAAYQPVNNRSQIVKSGTNTIILDAYNANPDSMEAALNTLDTMPGNRKVAILGDMFELGNQSEDEHEKIGVLTREKKIDEVFFCGNNMSVAYNANPESKYFTSKNTLENYLKDRNFEDSIILIKGSRGMGLESLINYL